jgi:hypothetical protein
MPELMAGSSDSSASTTQRDLTHSRAGLCRDPEIGTGHPPNTRAMAGSPLKRQRKAGVRTDNGSIIAFPRMPRVADLPRGWRHFSAAEKIEHLIGLDRCREILSCRPPKFVAVSPLAMSPTYHLTDSPHGAPLIGLDPARRGALIKAAQAEAQFRPPPPCPRVLPVRVYGRLSAGAHERRRAAHMYVCRS